MRTCLLDADKTARQWTGTVWDEKSSEKLKPGGFWAILKIR
jgi:hypothetical protein